MQKQKRQKSPNQTSEHWKAEGPGNSQLLFFWQWVGSSRFYWRHLYTLGRGSGPLRNPTEPDNSSQVLVTLVSTRPRQSWEKRRWLKPKAHDFFLAKVISFHFKERWGDTELTNLWKTYHLRPEKNLEFSPCFFSRAGFLYFRDVFTLLKAKVIFHLICSLTVLVLQQKAGSLNKMANQIKADSRCLQSQ